MIGERIDERFVHAPYFSQAHFRLLFMLWMAVLPIPIGILMGCLAFTGVFHALLVADQRGYDLLTALAMGVVGWVTSNLATALGVEVPDVSGGPRGRALRKRG